MIQVALDVALQPFDYCSGMMLRGAVMYLRHDQCMLVVSTPHIVADGWTINLLLDELTALLQHEGCQAAVPWPTLQYGDFIVWQRDLLTRTGRAAVDAYYATALSGAPPLILPHDREASTSGGGSGAKDEYLFIDRDTASEVIALSVSASVTPFIVLLAIYGIVLSHWSGQDDIWVVAMFDGRVSGQLTALVGYLATFSPIRMRVSSGDTFMEVLAQAKAATLLAKRFEYVPYNCLSEIAAARSDTLPPMTAAINWSGGSRGWQCEAEGSLQSQRVNLDPLQYGLTRRIRSDLILNIDEVSTSGMLCRVTYRDSAFNVSTVRSIIARFNDVLAKSLAAPLAEVGTAT